MRLLVRKSVIVIVLPKYKPKAKFVTTLIDL